MGSYKVDVNFYGTIEIIVERGLISMYDQEDECLLEFSLEEAEDMRTALDKAIKDLASQSK